MGLRRLGLVLFGSALFALAAILGSGSQRASSTALNGVGAGGLHTCGLTAGGGVKCWGDNRFGQLGNGTSTGSSVPVDVSGLTSGVIAIEVGDWHSCALTTGGGLKCWGRNEYGQLGNGTTEASSVPVSVTGLTSGVSAIAGGVFHSCALTSSGAVKCWGYNTEGELGSGSTSHSNVPVDVMGLQGGIAGIGAGLEHTCAATSLGAVKCWGGNRSGELGIGSSGGISTTPVDVLGLSAGIASVAVGQGHTCALTTGGGVKCWGWNIFGQLGNGLSDNYANTPVDVVGLSTGVAALSAGGVHTCALTTAGGAKCWGWGGFGQVGVGAYAVTDYRTTPENVCATALCQGPLMEMTSISAGSLHTCGVSVRGGVKCWGYNASSQLGDGTTTDRGTPVGLDSDRDGCSDDQELGTNQALGGRRNPKLFWDFFDTPDGSNARDRAIASSDIGRITQRYGSTGNPSIDPLSAPSPPPAYHTAFDRSAAPPGGDAWDSQAADGAVSGTDLGLIVAQYGHTCA